MTSLTQPRPGAKAKRPPAPPAAETYHLTGSASLHLEIRKGGRFWLYAAEPLPSDFGVAWRLRRVGGADRDAVYDVNLCGAESSCTCPDAVYRDRVCKHGRLLASFLLGECSAA